MMADRVAPNPRPTPAQPGVPNPYPLKGVSIACRPRAFGTRHSWSLPRLRRWPIGCGGCLFHTATRSASTSTRARLPTSFIASPAVSIITRRKAENMTSANPKQDQADEAARMVGEALMAIQEQTGLPTDAILAGAHAVVVAKIVTHLGGPMAAATCERAANSVRHLPSLGACSLACATPAGRA